MQNTYKGLTAQQIVKAATTDANGRMFADIAGTTYTVVEHDRVELANGNWTGTVVIENAQGDRIVLEAA